MATATIKKVSGYQAPDGSTHPTAKLAIEHTHGIAVRAQLEDLKTKFSAGAMQNIGEDERGNNAVTAFNFVDFMANNKDAIIAALTPKVDVRMRAPRKAKTAAAAPAPASAATGTQA
jgi:hypothetical protein